MDQIHLLINSITTYQEQKRLDVIYIFGTISSCIVIDQGAIDKASQVKDQGIEKQIDGFASLRESGIGNLDLTLLDLVFQFFQSLFKIKRIGQRFAL
jgi:hypothetical protein